MDGFRRLLIPGHGVDIDTLVGGEGPPLLLLHGFPQTRLMWHEIAPKLARSHQVVIPDLRGYGRSGVPNEADGCVAMSKREMALDQVAVMKALGHNRFAVVGHDRGARVAYRMALDHTEKISALVLLDILPTLNVWDGMDATSAMSAFHWLFLAQPYPLPEQQLLGEPMFFKTLLARWAAPGFKFNPDCLVDYLQPFHSEERVRAVCDDYRAGWEHDRLHDAQDLDQRYINVPVQLIWGRHYGLGLADPVTQWSRYAKSIRGCEVDAGHFVAEEAPEETLSAISHYLADIGWSIQKGR